MYKFFCFEIKIKLKSRPTRTCHAKQWPTPPSIGIHGKNVLNTLFIKLDKPAKIVKIDGLPEMWFLSLEVQKYRVHLFK